MNPSEINDWIVLAISLGTIVGLFVGWKKKMHKRFSAWLFSIKDRKQATERMVKIFPKVADFAAGQGARDAALKERETRLAERIEALSQLVRERDTSLRDHLSRQDVKLDGIAARLWGEFKLDPVARFICDSTGFNSDVNASMAAMLRTGESNIVAYGWKNYIASHNAAAYFSEVMQAFAEHRRVSREVDMVRGDGTIFVALIRIEPHPESFDAGATVVWFGTVTFVAEVA